MHKVLAAVAVTGVIAAIALGARSELLPRPERAHPADTLAASAWSPRALPRHAAAGAPARLPAPAPAPAPAAGEASASATASGPAEAPATLAAPGVAPAPAVTPAPAPGRAAIAADGGAQQSADALVRRAAAAYARVRSLSAAFAQVVRNPLLGGTTSSRGMLYERRPDRFLMRFSEPAGDVLVGDGRYFWVYYPSVDEKQVIRSSAAGAGQGVDLQAQFLGNPEKRFNARLEGRETVAGRRAYVVRLVPRGSEPFKELRVWLDPTDYLARRFEITDDNGSVRRLDLSNLRVNAPLSDTLFRFTPPAGAHVVARG